MLEKTLRIVPGATKYIFSMRTLWLIEVNSHKYWLPQNESSIWRPKTKTRTLEISSIYFSLHYILFCGTVWKRYHMVFFSHYAKDWIFVPPPPQLSKFICWNLIPSVCRDGAFKRWLGHEIPSLNAITLNEIRRDSKETRTKEIPDSSLAPFITGDPTKRLCINQGIALCVSPGIAAGTLILELPVSRSIWLKFILFISYPILWYFCHSSQSRLEHSVRHFSFCIYLVLPHKSNILPFSV